jgi:predicted nucleotidyltransferase
MIPAFDINLAQKKAELAILKSLIYFDIFNYPLSENDIKNFLECYVSDEVFTTALEQLVFDKIVFKVGEFYSLQNDRQHAEERIQGNLRAQKLLDKAAKVGAFIYKFPYVRAVAVSGSLSKNYADKKSDIDFFIITKANRLWIARTFLHLFKKLTFLTGKQHFYCMNYFVDENALTIPEKNIYTAIEIATLLPIAGTFTMNKFFENNDWTEKSLPCYDVKRTLKTSEGSSSFKKFTEWIFNGGTGDRFDNFLFNWTTRRWKRKEQRGLKNVKGKIMNLCTGKHFSKSNPETFQEKILAKYDSKIERLFDNHPQYFD